MHPCYYYYSKLAKPYLFILEYECIAMNLQIFQKASYIKGKQNQRTSSILKRNKNSNLKYP
jgi:hypothetical protein